MPTTPVLQQVTIDYFPRGPKVIRATDDPANDRKFRNRGLASADLLREVAEKVIAHRKTGADIVLTVDADGFIIPDPAFTPPAAGHIEAVRAATDGVQAALAALERTVAPPPKPKKATPKRKPKGK